MKNIFEIMKEYGLEVPEDKKKDFEKTVLENYKTVTDYDNQTKKLETADATIKKEYDDKIADRDFNDILKDSIATAKGKNAKAITALLDTDALKASKNQKEDIAAALKALTEAEDSKMLFGEPEPDNVGSGNPIGTVTKGGDQSSDAAMRAVMGLPPISEKK